MEHDPVDSVIYFVRLISKNLKYPLIATFVIWAGTWFIMDSLPPPSTILSDLYQEPVQESIDADPFSVTYNGQQTDVEPVASYVIRGLVVANNHPKGVDISHHPVKEIDVSHGDASINTPPKGANIVNDHDYIDTYDLCILWGDELKTGNYQHINFSNLDYTCKFEDKMPDTTKMNLSNNHLMTDKEVIGNEITDLHIGDQVMITGKLVNYSEKRWNGYYRHNGDNGSEIIFVEDIKVLKPYNVSAILLHNVAWWLFVGLILFKIVLICCFPLETSRLRS